MKQKHELYASSENNFNPRTYRAFPILVCVRHCGRDPGPPCGTAGRGVGGLRAGRRGELRVTSMRGAGRDAGGRRPSAVRCVRHGRQATAASVRRPLGASTRWGLDAGRGRGGAGSGRGRERVAASPTGQAPLGGMSVRGQG